MAAAVHKLFHHHHDSSPREPSPTPKQDPEQQAAIEREREDEKRMLAQWADRDQPLSPSEIMRDEDDKMVGHSSRALRQEDFELIKTLGTGRVRAIGLARNTSADAHPSRHICARMAGTAHECPERGREQGVCAQDFAESRRYVIARGIGDMKSDLLGHAGC